ncbi:carbon storage regulator [Legionella nautarum]|uniref:Translational regulator CsrA n=1 Tax=Legionella nautarum TaxID=45070 RepID=A0A0W0WIN7_9GAMM|nr:carbon storage regulator CsrA [Legionella nautarum]KTD32193.1 carbon storage regulator [Legionella nautarum]
MLILSRRIGEALMIGTDIKLTVAGIKGNQVKFAIEAPREIPIHRQEIYNKIEEDARNSSAQDNKKIIKIVGCKNH